jgi:hypothetical protein
MPAPNDLSGTAASDAVRARAARLEARLAVYAQYAAVVAEQAAATLAGDEARATALAEERERVAEHFGELRAPVGGAGAGAASFGAALDDALAELAHQGAVDSALGARLATLREAVMRGASWGGAAAGDAPEPARPALRALAPGAAPGDGGPDDGQPGDAPAGELVDGVFGGALVAARAAGVGGALDGHYPGRAARDEYAAGWPAGVATAGATDAPRFDIRF